MEMSTQATPKNSQEIYEQLKEEILNLELKPGQPLSEKNLCTRFSVSRTPIRSVLQRLKDEGLVNVVPYKETTVTLLSMNDIEQHIYMRIAIESMVLRDFMKICTPIQLEKARYILRKQTVLLQQEFETPEFYQLDSQYHQLWFDATGKELLWKMIQQAQVNYTRFRMLDIVAVQNYEQIMAEHWALFSLLEKKDLDGVEPLMRKHLYGGIIRLDDRINTEFKDYFEPFEYPILK